MGSEQTFNDLIESRKGYNALNGEAQRSKQMSWRAIQQYVLVGGTLLVLTWSGLRVWSAKTLTESKRQTAVSEQQSLDYLQGKLDAMPAYKLTFLGAKLLNAGDYEFAQIVLKKATEKDRFYPDAFRYYAYVLQAMGENDRAELALRRAHTLGPRISQ